MYIDCDIIIRCKFDKTAIGIWWDFIKGFEACKIMENGMGFHTGIDMDFGYKWMMHMVFDKWKMNLFYIKNMQ